LGFQGPSNLIGHHSLFPLFTEDDGSISYTCKGNDENEINHYFKDANEKNHFPLFNIKLINDKGELINNMPEWQATLIIRTRSE
jgi:hypothetical protein